MKSHLRLRLAAFALLLIASSPGDSRAHEESKKTWDPAKKWADAVAGFKEQDAQNPPPPRPVVFLGSSSFRMWDLEEFFPDLPVVNRGFGGSTMPDALHFAETWVVPLKPSCILIYEGDNDINNGWSADEVFANFRALIKKFDSSLPGTPVIFVAIKPSISRWKLWPEMRRANRLIEQLCSGEQHLHYADIAGPMFEFNGLPKAFLFERDGLHLNKVGYTIWTGVIGPLIRQVAKTDSGAAAGRGRAAASIARR